MEKENIFDQFTGKYQLSKTLRFELRPVGKTLEKMRAHLEYDDELQTFLKDQRIEDAYQTLKPIVDKFHEEFITDSLQSRKAKSVDFSQYAKVRVEMFGLQRELKNITKVKGKNYGSKERGGSIIKEMERKNDVASKIIENLEKKYRAGIGETFTETGDNWKDKKYKDYDWKIGSKVASGAAILSSQDLLKLIGDIEKDEKIQTALAVFKGFFTYFSGFNQNRENYYETEKEAATAVATRIVYDNLPKFSDNAAIFEARKEEYLGTYDVLEKLGKNLVNRDEELLTPIPSDIFKETYFNTCLSQNEIEQYNKQIGNANFLINLYNQVKKDGKDFKKLTQFKVLYKQIGCGKKKPLFFELTHERKAEAELARKKEPGKKAFSVEEMIAVAKSAGETYLKKVSKNGQIETVPDFLKYIKEKENFEDVYWSKTALNTISNRYFADWSTLKEKLKAAKVFGKPAKGSEEDVKISAVIELEALFAVLDAVEDENWKDEGVFFRKAITEELKEESKNEKNQKRREIILQAKSPSRALLHFILDDIEEHAQSFVSGAAGVEEATQAHFLAGGKEQEEKRRQWKEAIKAWIDNACNANAMLKYFLVKENKIKGNPLDPVISNGLKNIFFESKIQVDALPDKEGEVNWFKWRDALRNFLTKKPQDDAKENKLKLNFENGSLLGGWSDGQEKSKAAVLLRNGGSYYLGILKSKKLFDTENENNEVYKNVSSGSGRLILANLKFQTLAGKGFLGEFRKSYGVMGKENSQEAISGLQKIIKDRYEKKYPPLKRIADFHYSDKKIFDKDIQDTLKECYICKFTPVDWEKIESFVGKGEMYLFLISSKDTATGNTGRKDLQTFYWNAVLEEKSPFQLNGGGEIFYRKHAISEKKIKSGYENKPWIIENKRFTENKQLTQKQDENPKDGKSFFFHCSITLNYKAKKYSKPKYAFPEINKLVNDNWKAKNTYFLGIDRGEKHLAYYSLVGENGKLIKQGTLNLLFVDKNGNPRVVKAEKRIVGEDGKEKIEIVKCLDYNQLLEARAGDRDYARKNWQTIGLIKNLKEGYVSQVVRVIADLATKEGKPTYIVLEDLNTGFKRSRQKIEKSVYQKFELALAKKLNFLVDKQAKIGEISSVTRALQLTPPVNTYGDIEKKKQAGIMLYTRPNYTSQTDPVTGWRKSIYLKKGSEDHIKDQILGNGEGRKEKKKIEAAFSEIGFDGKDYYFVYTDKSTGKRWKLYSGHNGKKLDRFRAERNSKGKRVAEPWNAAAILDGIFEKFDKRKSLLEQMGMGIELTKLKDEKYAKYTAWESLRFAIDLIQQIRNTGTTGRDEDFLLSPVRDENGNHFDTRIYWDKEQRGEKAEMPTCGDAIGAFNIAQKGIIMNEHIKRGFHLYISDEEWDTWLAGKDKWENWLKNNTDSLEKKYNRKAE